MSIILKLSSIFKSFDKEEAPLIKNVNLQIKRGEVVSLIGESGSGKSTLLHIIGLLDKPTSGSIILNDIECVGMNSHDSAHMRLHNLGFVYQFHYLLQEFNVLDNIILPQIILNCDRMKSIEKARDLLNMINLSSKEKSYVSQLSGGEKQRIAIARALINEPSLLIADEPTGNLDEKNTNSIFSLLYDYAKKMGIAVLFATHNENLAGKSDAIIKLKSGILLQDVRL